MPDIGRIQSTNFQSLLTELGITRNNIPFVLKNDVVPVVLVGGTVSFLAAPTPAYQVTDIFTAGVQVAPAVNFVLADTGPLAVGAFTVQFIFNADENTRFAIQWRDAANAANLWLHEFPLLGAAAGGDPRVHFTLRFDVQNQNERFRVLNLIVGTAGNRFQATIMAKG